MTTTNQPDISIPTPHSGNDIRAARIVLRWQATSRFLSILPWAVLCRGFRRELEASDIQPGMKYVVASNHQSRFDSFTLLASFPPELFAKLRPFRAMTANMYFKKPVTRFAALGMGCYPAKSNDHMPYGIAFSAYALEQGHTVYICPEGGLTRRGERPVRPGIAALANLENVMIIPAHIEWKLYGRWLRTFRLGMGKPFSGRGMTAEEIMDRVYAQPVTSIN